jgi:hypothetical protein
MSAAAQGQTLCSLNSHLVYYFGASSKLSPYVSNLKLEQLGDGWPARNVATRPNQKTWPFAQSGSKSSLFFGYEYNHDVEAEACHPLGVFFC